LAIWYGVTPNGKRELEVLSYQLIHDETGNNTGVCPPRGHQREHRTRPRSHTRTAPFGLRAACLLQLLSWLSLTRISPNRSDLVGLVINTGAAVLFGFANEHNYVRMFLYAGW